MNLAQRLKRVAESLLIAIAIAPLGFLVGEGMPAFSATHSPDVRYPLKQDPPPPPPYDTIAGGGQWNLWRGIFDSDPPFDSRDGGSRGEGFCIIAPMEAEGYRVASDRPTFVWRGTAENLEVMRADGSVTSVDLGEVPEGSLITFELPSNPGTLLYAYTYEGEPLPPGLHQWRIQAQGLAFSSWWDFEIVDSSLQSQIVADRSQIQRDMTGESEEAIAIAQANDLANQQFWSDFWAEILSVNDPSEQLTGAIQELTQNLCDPLPTETAPPR